MAAFDPDAYLAEDETESRDGVSIPKPRADEKKAFEQWLRANKVNEPFHPDQHYDYVGAFRAGQGRAKGDEGHFTDQFKLPGHETFSDESQYAKGEFAKKAGHWDYDHPDKNGQPTYVRAKQPEAPAFDPDAYLASDKPAAQAKPEAPKPGDPDFWSKAKSVMDTLGTGVKYATSPALAAGDFASWAGKKVAEHPAESARAAGAGMAQNLDDELGGALGAAIDRHFDRDMIEPGKLDVAKMPPEAKTKLAQAINNPGDPHSAQAIAALGQIYDLSWITGDKFNQSYKKNRDSLRKVKADDAARAPDATALMNIAGGLMSAPLAPGKIGGVIQGGLASLGASDEDANTMGDVMREAAPGAATAAGLIYGPAAAKKAYEWSKVKAGQAAQLPQKALDAVAEKLGGTKFGRELASGKSAQMAALEDLAARGDLGDEAASILKKTTETIGDATKPAAQAVAENADEVANGVVAAFKARGVNVDPSKVKDRLPALLESSGVRPEDSIEDAMRLIVKHDPANVAKRVLTSDKAYRDIVANMDPRWAKAVDEGMAPLRADFEAGKLNRGFGPAGDANPEAYDLGHFDRPGYADKATSPESVRAAKRIEDLPPATTEPQAEAQVMKKAVGAESFGPKAGTDDVTGAFRKAPVDDVTGKVSRPVESPVTEQSAWDQLRNAVGGDNPGVSAAPEREAARAAKREKWIRELFPEVPTSGPRGVPIDDWLKDIDLGANHSSALETALGDLSDVGISTREPDPARLIPGVDDKVRSLSEITGTRKIPGITEKFAAEKAAQASKPPPTTAGAAEQATQPWLDEAAKNRMKAAQIATGRKAIGRLPVVGKMSQDAIDIGAALGGMVEESGRRNLTPEAMARSFAANPSVLHHLAQRGGAVGQGAQYVLEGLQKGGMEGLKARALIFAMNPAVRAEMDQSQAASQPAF